MQNQEILTVQDATARYRREWLAVRVVERDETGQPLRVSIIAHSPDRHQLRRMVQGQGEVCILYGGPSPEEGWVAMF